MVSDSDKDEVRPTITDNDKERLRLVELDYDQTNDFIKSVVSTEATLRGAALTIWLGLVGFAIQQGLWELGALALFFTVMSFVLDGYHGWLYDEALKHARATERVTSRYYDLLSRGEDDSEVVLDFHEELRFHRFGLFSSLHQFRWSDLLQARPKLLFRLLYPSLFLVSGLVVGLVAGKVIGK